VSVRRTSCLSLVTALVLLILPAVASAAVTSNFAAGTLTVESDAGDAITITCVGGDVKVNGADPDGVVGCDEVDTIDVTGGPGANAITLTGVDATAFPNLTAVTVDGGAGNDTILGSQIDDDLFGGGDDDRIVGDNSESGGADLASGEDGDDTMVWNPGDGDDVNDGGGGTDTIEVNGGGGAEDFTVAPSATAGQITFRRESPAPFSVEGIDSERLDLNAGGGDDSMESTTANGFLLDIDGGDGNDLLDGGDGPDLLAGGNGDDDLFGDDNPAGTRDTVQGGAGDDFMVWDPGDDDDTNDGGDGTDTVEVNGGGGSETFTVAPGATAGRISFNRTSAPAFNVDIGTAERLDLNAGGGDDSMTSTTGTGFFLDLDGGPGNDTLDGGDDPDLLTGGDGNDRLIGDNNAAGTRDTAQGGAGDDTLVWNPGDGDDTNDGGDGTDTIEVNGGSGGEVFTVAPSTTAGRIAFNRTGPTPPGPFNLDIGTAERLDLNAGGGDDSMTSTTGTGFFLDLDGGDGNDTLDGGDDADLLTGAAGNDRLIGDNNPAGTRDNAQGGAGDDTMVWNPGDGDDINEGGDGTDTTEVNGGSGGEVFTVRPGAVAGRVSFDRTGPTPPGPFNVDIGTTERLVLNAGGGDDRITGASGLASRISSTLNGDDGNDRITGTDGADRVDGGAGNDTIRTRDARIDRVACGAGRDLARVDRRDRPSNCEIVLGGSAKVRVLGNTVRVIAGRAVLRLRCVATRRCRGTVRLLRGRRVIGSARFTATRRRAKVVRVRLNRRGRRLLATAPARGVRITVEINARDGSGNGWRTTKRMRLRR
jgi:Ca2+-binding RTX toxin-like protein